MNHARNIDTSLATIRYHRAIALSDSNDAVDDANDANDDDDDIRRVGIMRCINGIHLGLCVFPSFCQIAVSFLDV